MIEELKYRILQLILSAEDLITPEDRVVTISHEGYAKTQPLEEYRAQKEEEPEKQQLLLKMKIL